MSNDPGGQRTCPWCSTATPDDATNCGSCGAALAQRESIGDLSIAGVTAVDPALQGLDGRPLRLPGPSPAQGVADGAVAALVVGGPLGFVALGGVAAVAAAEYAGAGRSRISAPDLGAVGRPSESTLRALEQLAQAERGPATDRRDAPPDTNDGASGAGDLAPVVDAPSDPWRDLPEAR